MSPPKKRAEKRGGIRVYKGLILLLCLHEPGSAESSTIVVGLPDFGN